MMLMSDIVHLWTGISDNDWNRSLNQLPLSIAGGDVDSALD